MPKLYVTYSLSTATGTGVGRAAVDAGWTGGGKPPAFRWSEIEMIEKQVLADARTRDPSITNIFLLDWKWLRDEAPSDAPSTTEADR